MPGKILSVKVKVGDMVKEDDDLRPGSHENGKSHRSAGFGKIVELNVAPNQWWRPVMSLPLLSTNKGHELYVISFKFREKGPGNV